MTQILADPALRGLEDRAPGSPCPSRCGDPGCTFTCHERHLPPGERDHDDFCCDQILLGRDVSEYRPDIRQRWAGLARLARAWMHGEVTWPAALDAAAGSGFTGDQLYQAVQRARLRDSERGTFTRPRRVPRLRSAMRRGSDGGDLLAGPGGHFGTGRPSWRARLWLALAWLRGWRA